MPLAPENAAPEPRSAPDVRTGRPVMVGLSGGVDSAVTLLLLKREGRDVAALFMKNWDEDDVDGHCSAAEDLADAERVCERLDVPLRTVNFSHEYWENVFTRFLAEYRAGRTPNPDVLCNREVKFQVFLEHALDLGAERIATGHYARIESTKGVYRLLRGTDPDKDQSYFLHLLDQAQLAKSEFPLGGHDKREVRALARQAGLETHDKADSTGICFIGERPFREFLARYLPPRPGDIESLDGEKLGEHAGLMYYTIGQRQGIGLGGHPSGTGEPWYVVDKDLECDVLKVVQGRHHPALHSRELAASDLHWIRGRRPAFPLACSAQIRHRQPGQPCVVTETGDDACRVRFHAPQWAVAPGQSVVFYEGDECLGGGIIHAATDHPRPR